ncbi:MAG: response regulator transcription factor [Lachnospiraceae bacterium]|nr:response regulator transcription factor [Lachnospiraceae bacterium]
MRKVLLVEDDDNITEGITIAFENAGIPLIAATDIGKARALMDNENIGLVLLDVKLPDGDGFKFYRDTLSGMKLPVIFLTARDGEDDVVKGINMGAEDYITKPFSVRELIARVQRTLMRFEKKTVLSVGEFSYDIERMELTRNGELIRFSNIELRILHMLFQNHDKAVKRSELIDLIWEATGNDVYDHTVTVYMKRIKDKLGADIITTIKGVGYRVDTKGAEGD